MSNGHMHLGGPNLTQNQGNVLGDRPCVRQSRLYREHVGGNAMKDIMGQDALKWDTNRTQGAYDGGHVYDHVSQRFEANSGASTTTAPLNSKVVNRESQFCHPSITPEKSAAVTHRRGAGMANKQTYNFMTGQ